MKYILVLLLSAFDVTFKMQSIFVYTPSDIICTRHLVIVALTTKLVTVIVFESRNIHGRY